MILLVQTFNKIFQLKKKQKLCYIMHWKWQSSNNFSTECYQFDPKIWTWSVINDLEKKIKTD